jgi:hypothetical protein
MKTEALMRLSGAAITTAALTLLSAAVQAAPNAQEARLLATLQKANPGTRFTAPCTGVRCRACTRSGWGRTSPTSQRATSALLHLRARHGHRHHDRSDWAQARTRRARARRVTEGAARRAGGRVGQVADSPTPSRRCAALAAAILYRIQRPCVRLLQAARTRAGEAAGRDGPHLPRAVPGSRAAARPCGVRSRPDEGLARPDAAWRRECPGRAGRLRDAAGPQSPTGPAAAN